MDCPRCQTSNPKGARFCYHCGGPLPQACPHCGAPVVPGARFCHNCGRALAAPEPAGAAPRPEPDAVAAIEPRLQQYIPKELLARLEAARTRVGQAGPVEGERRIVTALFSDVRGSTALAERLDPEEWAEVMNGAFECLIKPVYRYEGIVARLMGDAILAFFGAPIAHEDDPQRAVQAALDIVGEIHTYGEQVKRERGLDLAVRVGINTGLAVVGEVGSDLRVEYTAMGDAVNLAARMEETALPGTVQITGHTYRSIAPLFDVEPLGQVEVRGKSETVAAYRVIGPKARPGRVRGIEGLSAPLVGRERELGVLRQALDSVRRGQGQIVCLLGDAGLGKSRLIDELRAEWESADGQRPMWRSGRSPSYAATLPYSAFRELIRSTCDIAEHDARQTIRQKLGCACLPEGTPAEPCVRAARMVEVLLGASDAQDGARLEGEAFKHELFQSMLDIWRRWARTAPTVLVFDDLHWAEAASVDLLLHLFQLADEVPILFLCAFRPDREAPAWRLKQAAERDYPHRYAEVVLQPLSPDDANRLVDSLLAVADLPAELRALMMAKAEGNPFFVEEVIRELIEQGVVRQDSSGGRWWATRAADQVRLSIPDNLLALITARIDRLEDDTRHTLQLASVVGRTFYYRVLQHVAGLNGELDRQLRALQRGELIREHAREPELEYAFRHALTQEAAYNSILIKRRREFHRRVGETLENLYADRRDDLAPQMAHHFYEARDPRALAYCRLAGDAAMRLYANAEAADYYTRALEAAGWAEAGSDVLLHLYGRRGRALELDAHYEQALANYWEMEHAGQERLDRSLELAALVAQAIVHATPTRAFDAVTARKLCDRVLSLAREIHDAASEARILWVAFRLDLQDGRPEDAVVSGERSLLLARQLGLKKELAFVLNDLSLIYLYGGQPDRARAALQEARELWHELGDRAMLADNLAGSAAVEAFKANYDEAIRLADEAGAISRQIGNLWGQAYSRMYLGYIYQERGEMGRAVEVFEECLRLARQAGFMAPLTITRGDLGLLYARLGAVDRALDLLRQSLAVTAAHITPWESWILADLALVELIAGHPAAAATLLREAWESAETTHTTALALVPLLVADTELAVGRQEYERAASAAERYVDTARSYRVFMAHALYLRARVALGSGQVAEARRTLVEARDDAEGKGQKRMLWPILVALAEIEERDGDLARARELRCQARDVVQFIASGLGDPALRALFTGQADVQALLAADGA